MSWHMMVEFTPPLIACIVSDANFSHKALRATKECVIAIPAANLARKVVRIGNCSGRDTEKFSEIGLTPMPATSVSAPLVGECFANFECRVVNTKLASTHCLFILEVVKAWIDPKQKNPKTIHHHGFGRFVVDGETIHVRSKKP
jgi:flavin reductase (DIM6/NTAB) family NADH-FMN oxidoreductase RutF